MEGAEITKFIYQQSLLLEYLLVLCVFASVFKPRILVALATAIVLLRPNERMDSSVPFMEVLVPVLFIALVLNIDRLKEQADNASGKYLNYFILLVLAETLLLHTADFANIFIFVSVGYLLYYATILFMVDEYGMKLLCRTIILCCFLICLEPLYYHCTEIQGSQLWNMFHLPKSGRLQAWGMWANANETAFIACLGISNAVFLASKYKSVQHFSVAFLLVPFFAVIIFMTASRAGFASFLLIFLPSIVLAKKKSVRILAVVAILFAIAVSHSLTPERTDAQGSADERSDLRYMGKQIVKKYPLMGIGLMQARYEARGRPLHNTYLQAFAETGIFGGFLLTAFLFSLGRKLYEIFKVNRESNTNPHLIFVLGLYCSSIFYFFWGNQLLSIFFFLVIAEVTIATITACQDLGTNPSKCDK